MEDIKKIEENKIIGECDDNCDGDNDGIEESKEPIIDIIINEIHVYGFISYKNDNGSKCAICHNTFSEPCIDCSLCDIYTCNLSVSNCNHKYHTHCINKYFRSKNKNMCPLCNEEWGDSTYEELYI